jgi:hypothetical protein
MDTVPAIMTLSMPDVVSCSTNSTRSCIFLAPCTCGVFLMACGRFNFVEIFSRQRAKLYQKRVIVLSRWGMDQRRHM